jgi:hypothetical protein
MNIIFNNDELLNILSENSYKRSISNTKITEIFLYIAGSIGKSRDLRSIYV